MNESAKRRELHKRMLGFVASLLACFALVVALVPVQAVADDAGVSDPADLEAVSMPVPATNLVYTGSAQKLLAQNKGYTIEFVAGTARSRKTSMSQPTRKTSSPLMPVPIILRSRSILAISGMAAEPRRRPFRSPSIRPIFAKLRL